MKKKQSNERILIVSDTIDELKDIQHLLSEDFGNCLKVDNEPEGLRMFHEHHPSLLVLAFEEIERAEHFYLSLHMHDHQLHAVPHQTLLLCKGDEASNAYLLCRSGTFDDYVAYRPLYDPCRLRLSVAQAINRRSHEQYSHLLNRKIGKITNGLHQFNEFVSRGITSGGAHHQETMRTFHNFTQQIATDLAHLKENLIGLFAGKAGQKMDTEKLSHQIEQFRIDSLQYGSQNVVEQMNKTGNYLEELNKGYKDYVEIVQNESKATHSKEIMLIDDDEFYRDTLTTMLQDAGMDVVGIGDGITALTELQHSKPKLILLDYKMPGMNGIETLKQIKSNPDLRSIPVIMLTGISAREIVEQCIRTGAAGFIVKPGDRNAILAKIDDALKR